MLIVRLIGRQSIDITEDLLVAAPLVHVQTMFGDQRQCCVVVIGDTVAVVVVINIDMCLFVGSIGIFGLATRDLQGGTRAGRRIGEAHPSFVAFAAGGG